MFHLRAFLEAIIAANLTLNLHRCRFARHQVSFVGHVIGSGRHGPDTEKLKAVEQIREPHIKSDLHKILGLFSYFCMYLPDFVRIVHPLTALNCKNFPNLLNCTVDHKHTLDTLKHMSRNATKLHVVEYGKPFGLLVDASKTAIGVCLLQWSDDGRERLIAFVSSKLTASQQTWTWTLGSN